MTYKELTKRIKIFVEPLAEPDSYLANIRGLTPLDELLEFDIIVEGCSTQQMLMDTLSAELEEILSCKYHYEVEEYDKEDLLYDGGTFNESN